MDLFNKEYSRAPPKCFHLAEGIYRMEGRVLREDPESCTGCSVAPLPDRSKVKNQTPKRSTLLLQVAD
jgi:hypothetical protein